MEKWGDGRQRRDCKIASQKQKNPTLLLINKIDHLHEESAIHAFHSLGFKGFFFPLCMLGLGMGTFHGKGLAIVPPAEKSATRNAVLPLLF